MKKALTAAIILLALTGAASAQQSEPASTLYHSRYLLAGFLLRAGNVCDKDAKQTIATAFKMVSDPEMKAMSKGFPDTTARWMAEGSENFNRQVMKAGLGSACDFAAKTRVQASQLDAPPGAPKK